MVARGYSSAALAGRESSAVEQREALGKLPAVGVLIERAPFREMADEHGRGLVVEALRSGLRELRRAILNGVAPARWTDNPVRRLEAAVGERLRSLGGPRLRRVVNATGIIVHTNLGRAPLSDAALVAVVTAASGYSNLEFDLEAGARGSRQSHVETLLGQMFPGRSALVVNNAAGAVLLALDALAAGREVVVSRGELVEIGGSFRIPDILEKSGARLVEVGTTNRTRTADYRRAVTRNGADVGALLRVHQSNFRIVGFTEAAPTRELVALGSEFGIPVIEDFGSGNLLPLADFGVTGANAEPTLADRVATGTDLLVFSGDKLLGGPQAGILIGTGEAIARCRNNPLARALRADRMRIAGLQATLRSHVRGRAARDIPVWRAIARPLEEVTEAATALRERLEERRAAGWTLETVAATSRVGGGAAPGARLPTRCLTLSHPDHPPTALRARLLRGDPPVAGRIAEDRVLFDLRTVPPHETAELEAALAGLLES